MSKVRVWYDDCVVLLIRVVLLKVTNTIKSLLIHECLRILSYLPWLVQ